MYVCVCRSAQNSLTKKGENFLPICFEMCASFGFLGHTEVKKTHFFSLLLTI